jgi:hypothetical protein
VNGSTEEIVCIIRWPQIDHLRAVALGQRGSGARARFRARLTRRRDPCDGKNRPDGSRLNSGAVPPIR